MDNNSIVRGAGIIIKGAGEMASGVAVRLYRAGFRRLVMLETDRPTAVRRTVSFCEAVYDKKQSVEGIEAILVDDQEGVDSAWEKDCLPVCVDPKWDLISRFSPTISIDAVLAKRNLGTKIDEAPLVVALGPGFTAGVDAHRVIETNRGHDLGRVLTSGSAEANTGIPGSIGGFTVERVLRSPIAGPIESLRKIGDVVKAGETVCMVGGTPVTAKIDGILRGLIRDGLTVEKNMKIGDVDPRCKRENCFTVSDKARALGGAVLEAICAKLLA